MTNTSAEPMMSMDRLRAKPAAWVGPEVTVKTGGSRQAFDVAVRLRHSRRRGEVCEPFFLALVPSWWPRR